MEGRGRAESKVKELEERGKMGSLTFSPPTILFSAKCERGGKMGSLTFSPPQFPFLPKLKEREERGEMCSLTLSPLPHNSLFFFSIKQVWNNSTEPRVILIVDVWNSNLSAAQREQVCHCSFKVLLHRGSYGSLSLSLSLIFFLCFPCQRYARTSGGQVAVPTRSSTKGTKYIGKCM